MENLEDIQARWRTRIIDDCGLLRTAINELYDLALSTDAKFVEKVNEVDVLYCKLANTITLLPVVNGSLHGLVATAGCEDKARSP